MGCNRLTFTTSAPGVPMAALASSDDFATQQNEWGPTGGLAEVSLGTSPVGNADGRTGLFERLQQPSDSDPTQGGMEEDIDSDVSAIGFQFWDGLEWISTWQTSTANRRLPEAVQVSYTLANDPDNAVHILVVPIAASDVTASNPATQTAAAP